jgi:hypothetical protein
VPVLPGGSDDSRIQPDGIDAVSRQRRYLEMNEKVQHGDSNQRQSADEQSFSFRRWTDEECPRYRNCRVYDVVFKRSEANHKNSNLQPPEEGAASLLIKNEKSKRAE